MELVERWFIANKLAVNASKTKCMLFSGNRFREKFQPLDVVQNSCNNQQIEQVTSYEYLGVLLDPHLTFTNHIDKLCKKIKSRTFILRRWHRIYIVV